MARQTGIDAVLRETLAIARQRGMALLDLARRSGVDASLMAAMGEGRLAPTLPQMRRIRAAVRRATWGTSIRLIP